MFITVNELSDLINALPLMISEAKAIMEKESVRQTEVRKMQYGKRLSRVDYFGNNKCWEKR